MIKELKRIRGRELFGGFRHDRNRARSVVALVCRGLSMTAQLLRIKNRDMGTVVREVKVTGDDDCWPPFV